MRSVAAAFAWEFQRRLRWGLIAFGFYLAALAAVQLGLGPHSPIRPGHDVALALTALVPLSFAFMYFLAVFSYGLTGDLTARQSLYPARLFTLPIPTAALAGWPMLYGTTAIAALWVAATLLALWPAGVPAPLVWPAMFGAAFIAWMQALTWMPYGLPGMRVVLAVLWLTVIDAVAFTAIEYQVPESLMVAIMAPQIPLAYLAARYGLARARRGDTPDWRGLFSRRGLLAQAATRRAGRFASADRAQRWFEWRQHGRSLPAWVAILLPFEVLFLYVVRGEPAVLTVIGLGGMLLTPPFLAAFVALTVGRSSPDASSAWGLSPFTATRPLSDAALAAAKLRTAAAGTLVAWALVLLAVPFGLTVAGSWPAAVEQADGLAGLVGTPRAIALALVGLAVLLASTWKQIVQGLAIGLTGLEGLIKSSVIVRLSLLAALGLALQPLRSSAAARIALWNALPWLPAVFVAAKIGAAGWVAVRLHRGRLLPERVLVTGAVGWLAVVLAAYGVLACIFHSLIPDYWLLLVAVLGVPLARPAAVPLALAWSRRRGAPAPAATARASVLRAVLVLFAAPLALAAGMWLSFHSDNRHDGGFVSSGEPREYVLYVPESYEPSRPSPLVISLHGGALWGAAQRDLSGWNAVADEHGFLVAYPSGVGGRGPRAWRAGEAAPSSRDVRFISELIDTLSASYNVDPARIYADGLSNGAGMAFVLSCTLSDRIAAVGLVASAHFLPWSECTDPRPVAMIAFHGTEDRLAPYHGGSSWVAPAHTFPSIPELTARWARRNRCRPEPVESAVAADVSRRAYAGCAEGADVVLYTIRGGGHTWPGGGPHPAWMVGRNTRSVDASREEWEFFRAHPLRSQ